ncbi:MAG: hypothetical protein SVW77_01580 [Candidatus Nanohaloarchaea archaeon]|nr:hypothetical protein [Candidatus Nanohaloarchaea archaeon]
MYSRSHAVVSFAAVGGYTLLTGVPFPAAAVWILIGVAAGVFIDADHVVLAAVFGDRDAVARWLRRPWAPFTHPEELLDDLEYGGQQLYYHRIATHVAVLALLYVGSQRYTLLLPAFIAVAVHIASDIAWDLWNRNYSTLF